MKYTFEEARKLWVEALRSGKYKQGQGCLKVNHKDDQTGYCCLGVACELYQEHEGGLEIGTREWLGGDRTFTTFDGRDALPPATVCEWLKIDHIGHLTKGFPVKGFSNDRTALTELNDSGGYTFDQIANIIEEGHLLTVE